MKKVKCLYCGKTFDRESEPCVALGRRYAHKACQIDYDRYYPILQKYLCELFRTKELSSKIEQQLHTYTYDKHYSYEGISNAIKLFYELKHNSIENSNGGIGIVPYIYDEAMAYFDEQKHIKDRFASINLEDYVPTKISVEIAQPTSERRKMKKFALLDGEE